MLDTTSTCRWRAVRSVIVGLALTLASGVAIGQLAGEDAQFVAVEKEGSKAWNGGGPLDLKGRSAPLTLKVSNPLAADHGFSIDSMNVKEVIKPGEEKTISVPLENIDTAVSEHKAYCQLHPKHIAAALTVTR
ncbi:MAG: hypothetical protein EPO02_00545 [Nitrospirae bacterium]|nr:MAG: hypothetical protein EPO02_00545 [Nitrospirota bacterium]